MFFFRLAYFSYKYMAAALKIVYCSVYWDDNIFNNKIDIL